MDDLKNIRTLCTPGSGFSVSTVQVEFREDFNMKSHPLYRKHVNEVWDNKMKNCSNLFNATKFRLHDTILKDISNPCLNNLTFQIGVTCYKDFIGTNCAPYADELHRDGLKDYQNPQAYMADPIGVGAILITTNDDTIFMRRSENCAEMPLMIDRPGGHPEPDVVTNESNQDIKHCQPSRICEEVFDSVLKEIRDEINVPLECLSQPILLGIDYNPDTWRRPSLEFIVRCSLSTYEVQELYQQQTQAESEESTELIVVELTKLIDNDFKNTEIYRKFTHAAKTAICLLKNFLSK